MTLNSSLRCRLVLFATATLLATAVVADTSDVQSELPKCAVKCLAVGAKGVGCSVIDTDCQCNHLESIIKSTSPCLVKAGCDLQEISDMALFVGKICSNQIANLTSSSSSTTTPSPMPTGAANSLPKNIAWTGAAAAMAAVVAVL
ncbi:hypothetical protein BGZ63DRAFT_398790 [Mariannaea sp. PMI_226]|nr:hypothetical protein BGZ63DRAFT_398790 [Mariannaea sp. PMI_226]